MLIPNTINGVLVAAKRILPEGPSGGNSRSATAPEPGTSNSSASTSA